MTLGFLVVFGVFAVIDWVAVAMVAKRVEYIAKPAALLALVGYAATADHPSAWLIAALACSLLGDVLLMLPRNAFIGGLSAFLVAHVAYIICLGGSGPTRLAWFAAIVVVLSPVAIRIVRAAGGTGLRAAVACYIGTVGLMMASALASGDQVAALGALSFVASDTLIGWNRFVRPVAWAQPAIMITYHLGQLGLATALR